MLSNIIICLGLILVGFVIFYSLSSFDESKLECYEDGSDKQINDIDEDVLVSTARYIPSKRGFQRSNMMIERYITSAQRGILPFTISQLWTAHPHNYQTNASDNTPSSELYIQQGWASDRYANSCAIRMSICLNRLPNGKISKTKAISAGIPRNRVVYSSKTRWYYLVAASEITTYIMYVYGSPYIKFPRNKNAYIDEADFNNDYKTNIEPFISKYTGIVCFEKIFGYSGTGHVDVFNKTLLSDAPGWDPCKKLRFWLSKK